MTVRIAGSLVGRPRLNVRMVWLLSLKFLGM